MICELLVKYYPGVLDHLQYLSTVHHGMPDLLCFRNGEFKFVECKLGYETLSERQKLCIKKLILLGFEVEVHRLADNPTKTRMAEFNLETNTKVILEVQQKLKS